MKNHNVHIFGHVVCMYCYICAHIVRPSYYDVYFCIMKTFPPWLYTVLLYISKMLLTHFCCITLREKNVLK